MILLDLVGRGGFGEVYAGRLETPGGLTRRVAVKLLRADVVDEQTIGRTIDEAHLLARLSHPTVVAIEDLVHVQGRLAIISEYVDGVDVSEAIPMPPLAVLEVLSRVAEALHAAWSSVGPDGAPLRIVHRDIKPSNIRVGPNGVVKLLDFGIARSDHTPRRVKTGSGLLVGSIGYVAPERWLGQREEHAADIYALGCVLAEAITGVGVFSGVAPVRHMAIANDAQVHADWIDQSLHTLQLQSPVIAGLAKKMLAWEPSDRLTALQFARLARRAAASIEGDGLLAWSGTIRIPASADWTTAEGTILAETDNGFRLDGAPITAELETLQRPRVPPGTTGESALHGPTALIAPPVAQAPSISPPVESEPAQSEPRPVRVERRNTTSSPARRRRRSRALLVGGAVVVVGIAAAFVLLLTVGGLGLWGWTAGLFAPSDTSISAVWVPGGPGEEEARPDSPGDATDNTAPVGADGNLGGDPVLDSESGGSDTQAASGGASSGADAPGATAGPRPSEPVAGVASATGPSGSRSTSDRSNSPALTAPAQPDPEVTTPPTPVRIIEKPPVKTITVKKRAAEPAALTGTVVVTGRAQVRLRGAGGAVPIGDVPAGTYKVEAAFSDSVFREFGAITVQTGKRYTINCDPRFRSCVVP
ncbi:MAG: protein kinase [Myxococcota bacterium]